MAAGGATWVISDLHLDAAHPELGALLAELLARLPGDAARLLILGDLFEAWIGDDDPDPLAASVAAQLRALADSGVAIGFMHGNRDFLLGADYARRAGFELLPDPCLIDLHGTPTLLLHGDTLCSADVEYQRFRQMVRQPAWQQQVLGLPLAVRRAQAAELRARSRMHQRQQPLDIGDADPAACAALFEAHGVHQVIHGHTHRPAVHQHPGGRRIVLGDWGPRPSFARFDGAGGELHFADQILRLPPLLA